MPPQLPPTTLLFTPPGRRPLALPLTPGQVVVVADASGVMSSGWEFDLFYGSEGNATRFIQDGNTIPPAQIKFVGINDSLPETTVREHLAQFCNDPESIIREFELSEVATLRCAYLPPAAGRQVALLEAFSQEKSLIVLNDPFLPFNGRWRESFAGFVAEQASLSGSIVVCCNVGFIPKTWTTLPTVRVQDIAGLLPLPSDTRTSANSSSETTSGNEKPVREINEKNAAYYAPGIPIPIPASAIKVYKEAKDWFFAPLARAYKFVSTWSGALAVTGLAVVLGTMGVIFVPNLSQSHAILKALAARFDYTRPESQTENSTQGVERSGEEKVAAIDDQTFSSTNDQMTDNRQHNSLPHHAELDLEGSTPQPPQHLPSPDESLPLRAPWSQQTLTQLLPVPNFELPGQMQPAWVNTASRDVYLASLSISLSNSASLVCPPQESCTVLTFPLQNRQAEVSTPNIVETSAPTETEVTLEDAPKSPVTP